ncbi:MAG: U32 family peptidase, partial [Lachnospiraceae bacterium]|nr:U32 family peptidase [Lachnospiraceae bacterium]
MEKHGVPELLSPAGSAEALHAAINAGADAVYVGGRQFGARAYADNPTESELIEGIEYCHLRGKKLYLTVNTLLKEDELRKQLYDFLEPLYCHGVDAVLVQDLGVLKFLRENFPDLPVHASTQMSITTPEGAQFLLRNGVSRVV